MLDLNWFRTPLGRARTARAARRARPLLALCVPVLAGCAPTDAFPGPSAPPVHATGAYAPLASFYTALANAARSPAEGLQIGDSHTANDAFSGHIRTLLQARFGDAGRGMLPPGIPHDWYRPARVSVTSDGWQVLRTQPVGLPALRQHADGPAIMTISTDPGDLAPLTIELLAQPGGGTVDIAANDKPPISLSTAAATTHPIRIAAPSAPTSNRVTLSARGNGPVDMLSWTAGTARPGVAWSNLGTVGATMALTQSWDPAIAAAEAAALHPALVMLAFGTNEGFKDSTDLEAYPGLVRAALARLRAAAPGASILVAGPPAGVRPARAGGAPCPDPRYAVPPNLPRIRAILHQVAAEQGAFFWDWADAMGGDCAIVDWAETTPPLAARDHVHLLVPGAQRTAAALFTLLMQGYDQSTAPP